MAKSTKRSAGRSAKKPVAKTKVGPRFDFKASYGVVISSDGALLATCGKTGGPTVWDIASGRMLAKCDMFKHSSRLAFSPSGKFVAGFSTSGEVSVCDAQTGVSVAKSKACQEEGSFISFSPGGKELAAANWGGEIWSWNTRTWKAKCVFEGDVNFQGGAFLPDG